MRAFVFTFLIFILLGSGAQNSVSDAENYFAQQQFDSAITIYNQLIEEYPDTPALYFNRGLCHYKLNQPKEAITDFDFVLAQDSANKEALYLKALSLEQKGEREASVKVLERLHAIDENYNDVAKRIKNYRLAVYLSRKWYYMVAMALLVIIFLATVVTLKTSRRV